MRFPPTSVDDLIWLRGIPIRRSIKLEIVLTHGVPRLEETHVSHTKGLFAVPCIRWEKRL